MKVAKLVREFEIEIEEIDIPVCGPGDVLIRTAYAGVCGSDVHAFKGQHPFRKPPVVLGHETVGTVAEVGDRVKAFKTGDRVTVMPFLSCGECVSCMGGRHNICKHRSAPGTGNWTGTFAEYFLAKAHIVFRLGQNTSMKAGVLAEPFAVGIHSLRQGRMAPGNDVAILGAGTVGLFTGLAARSGGAKKVAVTDLYENNLSLAVELFGAKAYNASSDTLINKITSGCPDGFDLVMVCGNAPVMAEQALAIVKPGGRIVITGMFLKPLEIDLIHITLQEYEIIGTLIYDRNDFEVVIELLDKNEYDYRRLITHTFPLDEAQKALALAANRHKDSIKVLLSF